MDLETIKQESTDLTAQTQKLVIKDQESYEIGATVKKALFTIRKKIDLVCDPFVKSAKINYDSARDTKKLYLDPVVLAENVLKSKLKGYEDEMRKAEEVEIEKSVVEANAWGEDEVPEIGNIKKIDKVANLGIRRLHKAVVTDINKLPKEYLIISPNMPMLNAEAKTKKELFNIPGAKYVYE